MKEKLKNIIEYLNERFYQGSEEYSLFLGAKPQIIRYDNETAISLWACGAIVCIRDLVYFIQEDDGNWFTHSYVDADRIQNEGDLVFWKKHITIGTLNTFNIGWANSFIKAFKALNDYIEAEGEPQYYSLGVDENGNTIYSTTICNYVLK